MIEPATRLRDFTAELLQREGALIESAGTNDLEVIAPQRIQHALRISEIERLSFKADAPSGARPITLESDWLERVGTLLGERGSRARVAINPPAFAPTNPERILDHNVSLLNAVYNLVTVRGAWTRYLILRFRYIAFSDEERDGLVTLCVNTSNSSVLDESAAQDLLDTALDQSLRTCAVPADSDLPPIWSDEHLEKLVRRALPNRIHSHLEPFVNGLQRRLDRDLARVRGYYSDLQHESIRRMKKRDAQVRERLRLQAIEREYPAKVDDLRQKYKVRVEVRLSQVLELIMPVHRFEILIRRRKASRQIQLDWNPLLRRLDTPACEYNFTQEKARTVCDDQLHLVGPAAHAPCSNCQKTYCRACHPQKCPKCKRGAD